MFTRGALTFLQKLGIDPHRRYIHQLKVDYPVSQVPRYGYEGPPHSGMQKLLDSKRSEFETVVDELVQRRELLASIPAGPTDDHLKPYWNNSWFPPLDASILMHFLLKSRPKRYLEIGSGNSTIFANHAIQVGALATRITSIDPQPRQGIDTLCSEVIRKGLQETDFAIFDELEPGDILFFDGSHRVFQDSDVTVFFLEVLPRIRKGVIVHVHDIFWPKDYPAVWGRRYYSEQYMLAMLFLYGGDKYDTLFASAYASNEFRQKIEGLTTGDPILDVYGMSYWFT